jgi:hypothetical protein
MPEAQARAWWDEVQYLRDEIEERHAVAAGPGPDDLSARRAARERAAATSGTLVPRRTIEIRGQTVPAPAVRLVDVQRRRAARRPIEAFGQRPDRTALWALLMGITLILVAVLTAHS